MSDAAATRVLLVDPDRASRDELERLLVQAGFHVVAAAPESAPPSCAVQRPDVVLLDLASPEAARDLLGSLGCANGANGAPPVLALTRGGADARRRALLAGAYDVVELPVDETEILVRTRNAAEAARLRRRLDARTAQAEAPGWDSGEFDTVRESLSILAAIADFHDDDTDQHAQRVGTGAALVAQALDLDDAFVAMIRDAAPLHDIGKVGISRRILLKPGKLEPAEWIHMMRHVEIGARILAPARSPVLRMAAEIARTHHERWDGNGYLAGLVGEEIPLAGRITALVDVWDTLTHERPYKPAWDAERALAELTGQAGAHFDPRVVEAFLTIDRLALSAAPPVVEQAA